MKLTPLEIRKQEFRKAMRGFDPVEVQTFLEMVAEQYEQLSETAQNQSNKIIELETKLSDYQRNEKTLRETLVNLQEVKKQSEESSKRQADLTVKEAELKALEILENARKEARNIKEEIGWLKTQKESFINRLRHILSSQIELLSVMEIDDLVSDDQKEFVVTKAKRKLSGDTGETDPSDQSGSGNVIHRPSPEPSEGTKPVKEKTEAKSSPKETSKKSDTEQQTRTGNDASLSEDDINEFFKKGIQIDDLIKTLNKKEPDK